MKGRRKSYRPQQQGFTLLEVLLSTLLLALVMTTIYAAMLSVRHLVRAGLDQARREDQIMAVQAFLRRSLGQARTVAVTDTQGKMGAWLYGGPQRLRYVAPAPMVAVGAGLQVQQLRLVPDGPQRWRLEWRMAAVPEAGQTVQWRWPSEVLLDGIKSGQFAYRGVDTGEAGGDHWQRTWTQSRQLPRLIALQLQLAGSPSWPTLRLAPRIDPDPMDVDAADDEMQASP